MTAAEHLQQAVLVWSNPLLEDIDFSGGGEVFCFVYFPRVPASSLAGMFLRLGEETRSVVAFGPSAALVYDGEDVEPFFPYVVARRPVDGGVQMTYVFPVEGVLPIDVHLDAASASPKLLAVEADIPDLAQLYFDEEDE